MTTPKYKGPGQPPPDASGAAGWLGGLLGGTTTPPYKTATATAPACPPCKTAGETAPAPAKLGDAEPAPIGIDEHGDAVIPVGPGPITIVINPRP